MSLAAIYRIRRQNDKPLNNKLITIGLIGALDGLADNGILCNNAVGVALMKGNHCRVRWRELLIFGNQKVCRDASSRQLRHRFFRLNAVIYLPFFVNVITISPIVLVQNLHVERRRNRIFSHFLLNLPYEMFTFLSGGHSTEFAH